MPVGRGCSKVEGIDIELCQLSFDVQDGENVEKPPSVVFTDVIPRLPTHDLPVSDLLTLSKFIRCLSNFYRKIVSGFIFPFFSQTTTPPPNY